MDALIHLYDRVARGGFVIVDDYNSWESCRRAVHDFLATREASPDIRPIDSSGVWWRVPKLQDSKPFGPLNSSRNPGDLKEGTQIDASTFFTGK